jgi:hypothetical protein
MQGTETKGVEEKLDDETSGSAGFSGIKKKDLLLLRDKPVFPDPQLLDCSVQRRAGNSEFRCRTVLARNFPFTFRKGPFNNFSPLILESVWQFLRGWLRADQPSLFDPKGIAAGQDHRSFKCFAAHGYFPAMHTIRSTEIMPPQRTSAIKRFGEDWLAKSVPCSPLCSPSYFKIARTALSITSATSFGRET